MTEPANRPDAVSRRLAETMASEAISPEALQSAMFRISLAGIILFKPVYHPESGGITDFAYVLLNPAAQEMLKLPATPKDSLLQTLPHAKETGIFDFYRDAFLSGEPSHFNVNYQHDGLNNYFRLAAQRCDTLLNVSFTDTSDQDRTAVEMALRESQERERAAYAEADRQHSQLHNILMQAPAMVCIFEGPEHTFIFANPPYQQLVGDRPILGKPIAEAMPELAGQPVIGFLDNVYQTGEPFHAHEMLVQLDHDNSGKALGENYYNFVYQATRNLSGEIDGIMVFAYEVTTQVKARKQVQKLNDILEKRVQERTMQLEKLLGEAEKNRVQILEQQVLLQEILGQLPASVATLTGPEHRFSFFNESYRRLTGQRAEAGKSVKEVFPEEINQGFVNILDQVYATRQPYAGIEEPAMLFNPETGQNEPHFLDFIYQPLTEENGRVHGILAFIVDSTEKVMAHHQANALQAELAASAEQLRLITDALPVLIGYLDKNERYRFANKAYTFWFNQKPEELLGRFVGDVVGEKAYNGVKHYIARALAGERLDFEAEMPYRDGFVKHIQTSYVPDIRDGKVEGFYTLVTDITDQVLARRAVEKSEEQTRKLANEVAFTNQELQKSNQSLTRINIDLDNFIYTASHDLKAPILNIEGLMTALLDQLPAKSMESEPVQHILKLISDSVKRFKTTIEHLTDITKLQKENSFEAEPVQLLEKVKEVELDLAPLIKETGAVIEVEPTACRVIKFAQKNMRSILYNLISNAVKYHSPGRKPVVKISCEETVGYHILSVKDNGLGIEPDLKHKLFTMFTRLHDHVEGTGIGLYMVKKIIDNAGGKIDVTSQSGTGSEFRVWFPRLSEPDVPAEKPTPSTNLHDQN